MSGGVANTTWARTLADEFARCGVREVVIAPGSRSTPLVMAFARDGRFTTRVHLDERSAAFFALGVGKASGVPAVVITTSGTAVANVLPAVVEAGQRGVPLLVLSADRPHRLRDADANQAINQIGIFGSFVRAFFEMAPPTSDDAALRHLRGVAARAVGLSTGPDRGPIHLNLPFDKPLEPLEVAGGDASANSGAAGRSGGEPFTALVQGLATLTTVQTEALVALLGADRGVIVAGPTEDAERLGPSLLALAAATGYPLLADPLSGARYGPSATHAISGYDLFLRDEAIRGALAPDLIVRVGAAPTSTALQQWLLQNEGVCQIVVDANHRWLDHGATATHYVRADAAETVQRLAGAIDRGGQGHSTSRATWSAAWRTAERAATGAIEAAQGGGEEAHEGQILAAVLEAMPPGGSLFVSSSMPIRDLDAFGHARPEPLRVFANRGASGIDGVVSTAFGVASQRDGTTVCVIGDVAFFHDQNGLLWSREQDASVVFVLIDNDGGGIFHMLPIAGHEPDFTRYFATPHGIDPKHAAAAHGIDLTEVGVADLAGALARSIAAGRTAILRVRTDRESNHRRHLEVQRSVAERVRTALA
ncbi:MAG: 2-succinyl-5-enolpyruvyl-6-hydroxy-3-cyclohexene-1-carboxylic-acid synthase [Gemmatimonadetes bacterium]|nr:2-succinyl-5-enolpyruvyl-6-hydroxy-3-cyclohexene-1-carboxylic-acid synthase [Gemmatimonadota bacterium]MDA1103507.1 2-succinyl-5-enolpyruvyl-6-hydroxy-3-cyclohexene-1-carboxylic-acid synthase [Gemmatimonadota bacterium]